ITIGDINGIGPEIALKAISEIDLSASIAILISPANVIDFYNSELRLNKSLNKITSFSEADFGILNVLDIKNSSPEIETGVITKESGLASMRSIESAINLCINKELNAMVTLPISKESVQLAGYDIPGHTEFLAEKTNTDQVLMMLVNEDLRVALTTAHISISKVASSINQDLIISKATILSKSLKQDFGISNPKIAIFGLNPHAGDGGVLGSEEKEIIAPAIRKLKESGINVEGPFPADGFFGQKKHQQYDAILAMYHDQGLTPFKLLSFGKGVNFTAGLPIIRTSPDHGTAFDIAGKGIADPSSFIQAYNLAVELAQKN
ncbi:MAG: 4-hydroxythreonine-4-phosphate dehydrogenase PdxA, partial [Balneola sp.]|nr:4-hydroxythreonine-4-phosphate dehydrogenase PdxA [Balneola sp.]